MSCNCSDIKDSCSNGNCDCGIFIDIYEGVNILHTYQVELTCDCGVNSFTFNEGSINNVFHEDNREVTVRYNTVFSRWEMVFFDSTLNGYIPFALYYTSKSDCPASDDCWDDNRNVSYVYIDGVVAGVTVWDGTKTNGYKNYRYVPSQYPGTSTDPFLVYYDIATSSWILNINGTDVASYLSPGAPTFNFPNSSFVSIPPFTGVVFFDTYLGIPPIPGYSSPSGTLNIIKVRNNDCGCCDESVIIDVTYDDIYYPDVVANVVTDEYGNVMGINGYQYYSFELQLTPYPYTFYLYYTGASWVMSDTTDGLGTIYAELLSTNSCPFGPYLLPRGPVTSFSVIGSECFDCCDYYTPHNRNLLKKKKAIFVNEISSIRNKELFGFKCGPDWEELYKKHLIFDVLWCLPYGVICEDQEQCLIDKLNENCNC